MGTISVSIIDKTTGEAIAAKVHVLGSNGRSSQPTDVFTKVGPGTPFFYADGEFSVNVPRGYTKITVERGTEYVPWTVDVEADSQGTITLDVELERWTELGDQGWHPGNTHIHYRETEADPDGRLHLDPRVEDLRMTAVSILKRGDFEYATNKYPVGALTEFSSTDYYVQSGEENRHNAQAGHDSGYGHIMLLSLRNVVEPVSRGILVDPFDPDYPPLSYACDDTHRQGGFVIWCHNGKGMECSVAAALGKVDAFNLGDPAFGDREYSLYYRLLNTGIRLPASTGSDWFISNANRVYADTGGPFDYDSWVAALTGGKSFITNGPALSLSVDGQELGSEISAKPGSTLPVMATWKSHHPIHRAEIVFNGNIVHSQEFPTGSKEGKLEHDLFVPSDGWIAARLSGRSRNSYDHPMFAHTSPIYVNSGQESLEKKIAAKWLVDNIDLSINWAGSKGKFYTDSQRKEVVALFKQGQEVYRRMLQ